jgi:hypothetical protein
MTAHTQRAHAKLSPSASKRWMSCPGSIRMESGFPDRSSSFADEGTAAHTLCDHCLKTGFDADRFEGMFVDIDAKDIPSTFIVRPAEGHRCFEVTAEMAEGVQTYVEFCRDIQIRHDDMEVSVEQWLDLTHIPGMEGGTGDFLAYDPRECLLDVTDFKYGRGVAVEPQENPQLLCYALGAVKRYGNRKIHKVRLTVVQPRAPHPAGPVRTWEADVIDLYDFRLDLERAAAATGQPDAPLFAGEHCKFCKAAGVCPAFRDKALSIAAADFDVVTEEVVPPVVTTLDSDRLAVVLREAGVLEDWCRRVKEHAHAEAMAGRMPSGFKLVAKRATRRWKNAGEAPFVLENAGVLAIWTEPELKSPAQIEPLMPGKNKAERARALEALVVKESSGTVLAAAEDPRPAVVVGADEFEVME